MSVQKDIEDKIAVALLAQNFTNLNTKIDEYITQTNITLEDNKKAIEELSKEIRVFTTSIKAGKYIIITILLVIGAIGHKSIQWLIQFFTN